MRSLALLALACLALAGGCPSSDGESASQPAPANSTDRPADAPATVLARSQGGSIVEVRSFDDPANPYYGKYAEMDLWVRDNYDPGEENPANWPTPLPDGMAQRALVVDGSGFAVPGLEYLRYELERRKGGLPANQRPGAYVLYAVGELDESLQAASLEQRYRLIASYMEPIPQWLAAAPPKWALRLPDGSYATYGELGTGAGYFPEVGSVRSLRDAPACHYSAAGELLGTGEPGRLWCELFYTGLDGRLEQTGLTRDSVTTSGWYLAVNDFQRSRDPEVYFYDGTPVPAEEVGRLPDFHSLLEMYGAYIPVMYAAQNPAAGGANPDG